MKRGTASEATAVENDDLERAIEETDKFYERYAGHRYADPQVDRWLARWFLPFVQLRPGWRVLDLCCGDGCWSFGLLRVEAELKIEGVEISSAAVRLAKQRAESEGVADRAAFRVHDCEQALPYPAGSFDLIFARGLFVFNQHSMMRPATLELLDGWHRLLRSEGVFVGLYGSRPELMGSYTPSDKTVLPLNRCPRKSPAVDFRGGKYNHTVGSFTDPFFALPNAQVRLVQYEKGRLVVVSQPDRHRVRE